MGSTETAPLASDTSAVQSWLEGYCCNADYISEAVVVGADARAAETLAAWPRGHSASKGLQAGARAALRARRAVVARADGDSTGQRARQLVSVPIENEGRTLGAVSISVREGSDTGTQQTLSALERSLGALGDTLEKRGRTARSVTAEDLLQVYARVLALDGFADAAAMCATELALLFGCERATFGIRERKGEFAVAAVSHGAGGVRDVDRHQLIAAAMAEAVDQGRTLLQPSRVGDPPMICLAHVELLRHTGGRLCTVPCVNHGHAFGALTLERGGEADFQPAETAAIEHAVCLLAPVLDLLRARSSPWQSIREGWRARARAYLVRGRRTVLLHLAALAVLVTVLAWPCPLRISGPAHIEGAVQRAVTAAADGFVAEAHVRPGDAVRKDQLLAVLDQRDLELERQRWQSELARHQNDYAASLARADRSTMVVASARMQEARAQLALTEQRLDRAQIRAPFDALVIDGDLTRMLGAPVDRGQTLMTLAPLHDFRLMIEVDERDIERVVAGAGGAVALSARPDRALEFEVTRVSPVATDHDGRHFFTVEGRLASLESALRPGQEGVAKIAAGERTLAAVMTRRLLAWLRLQAFDLGL